MKIIETEIFIHLLEPSLAHNRQVTSLLCQSDAIKVCSEIHIIPHVKLSHVVVTLIPQLYMGPLSTDRWYSTNTRISSSIVGTCGILVYRSVIKSCDDQSGLESALSRVTGTLP